MREYYPLLLVAAVVGLFSLIFILAFVFIKDKKKEAGFERNMKDSEIIKRLLSYAKPYKKEFSFVFIFMLFSIMYDIVPPLIVGKVEEVIKGSFEMSAVYSQLLVYGVLILIALVSMYLQTMLLQKVGQKILTRIREDLYFHIESLSHNQLNHITVGKLVTRETNDTNAISILFTMLLSKFLKNCFVILGVFVAMAFLNLELTLIVTCFAPFVVLFTVVFRKFSRRANRQVKDGTTEVNTFLSENLAGIKIIQAFNNEEKKLEEFRRSNERLTRAKRSQILVFSIFRPMIYMLYISSILCLLYLSGKGYIQNTTFLGQTITTGILVSFYMYIKSFFNPIQNLAEVFNKMQSAFASAEKIFSIMDMVPEIEADPRKLSVSKIQGEIEFKNVWFKYEDSWILKDVSFHIDPGETVAFVGATGAGKTTILSLVCRNYDIQKGEILIDGKDIKEYNVNDLRSHFGQMLQDVFLFAGTVRSNIVLGEAFSDEEVLKACQYVNADRFIGKLEKGLLEPVMEQGNNFSAGERQLLSFARTLIHRPDVIILDEATANIDTETELLIQDSLEKMKTVGTMLIVAHRLSTIRNANRIIVLNQGEIVEEGSHRELLDQKGAYYELYKLQYEGVK